MSSKKKGDHRATLAKYNINTNSGLERFILDVLEAYQRLYPGRFAFLLDGIKQLKQVQHDPSGLFVDKKGRTYFAERHPTEILMFIQRWIPNFGSNDEREMKIFKKALGDLSIGGKDRYRRRTLWTGAFNGKAPQTPKSAKIERTCE